MKLVIITGPMASGKTTMLQLAFKEAGSEARLFSRADMVNLLRYLESGQVGLPMQSFVDEVTPELLVKLKKLNKQYGDEYSMTVVVTK